MSIVLTKAEAARRQDDGKLSKDKANSKPSP